jgi:hypothetical protein
MVRTRRESVRDARISINARTPFVVKFSRKAPLSSVPHGIDVLLTTNEASEVLKIHLKYLN